MKVNGTDVEIPLSQQKDIQTVRKRRKKIVLGPYLWLLPSVLLIFTVVLYPIIELLITSVSDMSLSGLRKGFIGLENFKTLFKDATFIKVLKNTLIWTVAVVGISTVLSLGIASLLNQEFPGRRFVRATLIVPWAVSTIITAVIWKWILDFNYGTLNLMLSKLGIIEKNIYWLADPVLSFPLMIVVGIFVTIPFTSFIFLSGLQSIPSSLYESASVDGANSIKSFFYITLPQLKPALTVSTVLNTIYVFNSFPIIWAITKGDPINRTDLVTTYLYKLAFQENKMGEAAAVSVISFILLLSFALFYLKLVTRKGD
ncbi:sugar ABC transporter permease [Fredinandcohnia sp. QZ13]|uniref:carbohydrate ABC transporter permease n=1 Tax=Fredinandcohnia sp. QZ13 TaxID=3073144 RepID=UPI0028534140|nr:sugar ABC transporter permease [Fredinandcohnia sp. QZ13]MDR4887497.1 sugar ABC transporter permease [Fredinandcohnia sp. QZ13]